MKIDDRRLTERSDDHRTLNHEGRRSQGISGVAVEGAERGMDTESEPYVRLATLRQLHQVVADLNTARSLADTLQAVADGVVRGLGYELAAVNLVRPDGDLVVAAFAGSAAGEALLTGRVGSRASWERRLTMGEHWGALRFIPHTEGWVLI